MAHYSWKVIFNDTEKGKLCTKEFLDRRHGGTYERVFEPLFSKTERCHPLNRLLYVDTKTFLLDDNLTKVDRMTMANSLEARVPFLDHELVEKMAMVDPRAKTRLLGTKTILRSIAKRMLPPRISRGKKRGFTPPLPFWIRNDLRDFVQDTFRESRISRLGLIDPKYCSNLLSEHMTGKQDKNREIWTLVSLISWAEKWRVSL
jgi:asparagine synthase (glutamine-hydrolysing)